jgi:GNAT superfamily N-acetyltransferase
MVIVDSNIDSGNWPQEFNNMWMNIFTNKLLNHIIFSLYNNINNESGQIIESEETLSINQPYDLPDAYISIDLKTGEISEIYVKSSHRGQGVGTMLCAFARSYLLNNGIMVIAPNGMTPAANGLFEYISSRYGEPYLEPVFVPLFQAYSDFSGGWTISKIEEVELNEQ